MSKHSKIAVIAHNRKSMGGGLIQLRQVLSDHGVDDPQWYEVPKSKFVPERIERARKRGATLFFAWGGDGTVQRSIDAMVGHPGTLAILPAGTANLLATNLGIPTDLEQAVIAGLRGHDRVLDVGRINGEHFAVMAGTGLDALMIRDADRGLKDRFGRAAYVWTGARHVRHELTPTTVLVDGDPWFDGEASCVLIGNVGTISGGITAFDEARPDDGKLDLAVVTADGVVQWARTLTRAAVGHTDRSPLVQMTTAKKIKVVTTRKLPYELDGGDRKKTDTLKIKVVPNAITIRVPAVS
jgi:diacylglycerol kinase (ATP)